MIARVTGNYSVYQRNTEWLVIAADYKHCIFTIHKTIHGSHFTEQFIRS